MLVWRSKVVARIAMGSGSRKLEDLAALHLRGYTREHIIGTSKTAGDEGDEGRG